MNQNQPRFCPHIRSSPNRCDDGMHRCHGGLISAISFESVSGIELSLKNVSSYYSQSALTKEAGEHTKSSWETGQSFASVVIVYICPVFLIRMLKWTSASHSMQYVDNFLKSVSLLLRAF